MGHGTMTCPFKPHLIFPTAQFPHSWSWTSTPSRNRKEKRGRRENGREKEWGHNLYPAGISPNFENEWMLLARDWKKTIILPSDCLVITNKHVLETLRFPDDLIQVCHPLWVIPPTFTSTGEGPQGLRSPHFLPWSFRSVPEARGWELWQTTRGGPSSCVLDSGEWVFWAGPRCVEMGKFPRLWESVLG